MQDDSEPMDGSEWFTDEPDSLGFEGFEAAKRSGLGRGEAAQESTEPVANADVISGAFGLDGPIDPAVWAAYADSGRGAASVGVEFLGGDRGKDVLIVSGRRYTFDEICLHGHLSAGDVTSLGYVGSYLRAVAASIGRKS